MHIRIYSGDTVTFYNGMIGTITRNGRLALIAPNGMAVSSYPKFGEYANKAGIKSICRSLPNPDPIRLMTTYRTLFADKAGHLKVDPTIAVDLFELDLTTSREEAEELDRLQMARAA